LCPPKGSNSIITRKSIDDILNTGSKLNKIYRTEDYFTGGTNTDIIISGAIFFQSFCDGTTRIDGVNIAKSQPYTKPLLTKNVHDVFTFNDMGSNARITIYYKY